MPTNPTRGGSFSVPPLPSLEDRMPDWQAVWTLLQVHRCGSIRACAKQHNLTTASIRRQLDRLEDCLGLRIFTRHVDGIRPTPEGEAILETARAMERAAIGLVRAGTATAAEMEGAVRVAVTEGLGAVWLTPRLVAFQQHHPGLRIDLACGMSSADVLRMEADLAIQLTRPDAPDVKVVRLGYMHVMPYASQGYLARHGSPGSVADLARHRLALQIAEQTSTAAILGRIFGATPFTGTVAVTTNTSTAHALAIANGAGIGWLPTYVSPLGAGLTALDCGAEARLDIWMTYHPDAERIPRIRAVIDGMRAAFDAKRYPFFGEARVHPDALPPLDGHARLGTWMPEQAR